MRPHYQPPLTESELLQRARALAGISLEQLAAQQHHALPRDLRRAKGWFGQLVERYLGATAGNQSQPDFMQLGVELKTLPLQHDGTPKETTYVCAVPLRDDCGLHWSQSGLYRKLRRVLWLPIEADPAIPLAARRIGSALLWSPSPHDDATLRQDWEEIMELIGTGRIDELSAGLGTYVQVRPKAANHRALTTTTDLHGEQVATLPRGFYLRRCFTGKILRDHYA
ncbi:MAG: DNA mismatch repair endonuclease MutH [Gammaproteobacteria bacterium]|nr:DNA mismatch repair endonuclease MutH [Gammaproteobacteria bacterium]